VSKQQLALGMRNCSQSEFRLTEKARLACNQALVLTRALARDAGLLVDLHGSVLEPFARYSRVIEIVETPREP
jgi:hypothetical protein